MGGSPDCSVNVPGNDTDSGTEPECLWSCLKTPMGYTNPLGWVGTRPRRNPKNPLVDTQNMEKCFLGVSEGPGKPPNPLCGWKERLIWEIQSVKAI